MPMYEQYFWIAIFFTMSTAVALAVLVVSMLVGAKKPNRAKLMPYECGFEPFKDARFPVNIKFALTAVLFIIFDIEIAFLVPFVLTFKQVSLTGFLYFMGFFLIITVGFIYEWQKGAFKW